MTDEKQPQTDQQADQVEDIEVPEDQAEGVAGGKPLTPTGPLPT